MPTLNFKWKCETSAAGASDLYTDMSLVYRT